MNKLGNVSGGIKTRNPVHNTSQAHYCKQQIYKEKNKNAGEQTPTPNFVEKNALDNSYNTVLKHRQLKGFD